MPFRRTTGRKLLNLEERTGEPFPSLLTGWEHPEGYGKASGSYTEKMRLGLIHWLKTKNVSTLIPITFKYKLSRHKIVTITGNYPFIWHLPNWGRGKKGFVLEIRILSIDGIQYYGFQPQKLAWNKIQSREKIFGLPAPKKELTESIIK